ncbi:TetR/AcrR family transcriptional regulator [Cupriavidus basilensis]|uniref:TetR/AcrR family transcriptional regulator n=1 Tax=Cupriavidus basilensis TaxID=68895 RepID=UPI0023E7C7B9|nr:TetR/AcrR family transcriptional regulator [Cupriavidus basilensis]MDF3882438.1 TetR/AcrR family transcriptional regulator [Cupriavidus basilensis]
MSRLADVPAQVTFTRSAGRPRGAAAGKSARHRFLEVGTDIVRSNGIRHLTIGELTRRVGVAKSTFYIRFTSREELLEAVLHEYVSALLHDANTAARFVSRGLQRLVRMIEVWIQHYVMKHGGCLLLNGSVEFAGVGDDSMRVTMLEMARAWRTKLAAQIQDAIQLGELRSDVAADQLLFEIFSVVLGVQHDCRFLGEPIGFRVATLHAILERHGAKLPAGAPAWLSI